MNAPAAVAFETETESGLDPVDEIRLRTWARRNYAPADDRDDAWHPVILDEMRRRDEEGG
ncbi:MAG: hypothetical protein WD066_05815 [Planctomycetaceae bacterium]